ncbi:MULTISPECIES: bifunctional DNA primase/polymerase [Streptomyces]|uniref:bifunctional DNA primase/polymerase n=1 Tax=Streptomyces TaxID=1883 RepID=UPI000F6564BA|nr:bifunctional DNA primase/polymerase [Streptomyces alboflavus]
MAPIDRHAADRAADHTPRHPAEPHGAEPHTPEHRADRRTATLALAHALTAAERGLAVIPLSRTKLPALRSPHHDEARHHAVPGAHAVPGDHTAAGDHTAPGAPAAPGHPASPGHRGMPRHRDAPHPPSPCRGECGRMGHGVYDASTDPHRIRELFAAAPWASGYGIACGLPPYHLIGIDLDTKSGVDAPAELRELALRHLFTIPETVVVATPSGGRHIWLAGPPDTVVPNSAGRLAPGIDIRGAGGYLVGPGSRTEHGVYSAVPGTAHLPPATCPPALLRLLTPSPRRRPRPAHAGAPADPQQGQGLVQFVLAAHEGQRNTRLFWAACRAYENGFGEALTAPLTDAALRVGLTAREAASTIASAARLTGHA